MTNTLSPVRTGHDEVPPARPSAPALAFSAGSARRWTSSWGWWRRGRRKSPTASACPSPRGPAGLRSKGAFPA